MDHPIGDVDDVRRDGCRIVEVAGRRIVLELPGVTRFVVKEIAQRLETPDRPALFMRFVGRSSKISQI